MRMLSVEIQSEQTLYIFDSAESSADCDRVCIVKMISRQLSPTDSGVVMKETAKDPVLSTVMRYSRDGWPQGPSNGTTNSEDSHIQTMQLFKTLKDSLSVTNGCLFYGSRLVIPASLQPQVLEILHLGHFGIQRMKQLARTAVYWPGVDAAIVRMSQRLFVMRGAPTTFTRWWCRRNPGAEFMWIMP